MCYIERFWKHFAFYYCLNSMKSYENNNKTCVRYCQYKQQFICIHNLLNDNTLGIFFMNWHLLSWCHMIWCPWLATFTFGKHISLCLLRINPNKYNIYIYFVPFANRLIKAKHSSIQQLNENTKDQRKMLITQSIRIRLGLALVFDFTGLLLWVNCFVLSNTPNDGHDKPTTIFYI